MNGMLFPFAFIAPFVTVAAFAGTGFPYSCGFTVEVIECEATVEACGEDGRMT